MNQPQPTIRSGLKIPFLDGTNDHLVFSRAHWNLIIAAVNSFLASHNWTVTDHGVILDAVGGGGGGWQWQKPKKELDGTILVPGPNSNGISTAVYISPNNPLVTIGATDLIAGVTILARPGIWIAVQDVPADTGSGYNVPQLPPILGVPSGDPLSGDADGPNVFWLPIWIYNSC